MTRARLKGPIWNLLQKTWTVDSTVLVGDMGCIVSCKRVCCTFAKHLLYLAKMKYS